MGKTALIIPVYNEEITIEETLLDFHCYIPDAYFYVIDNNSNDKTVEIATKIEWNRQFQISGISIWLFYVEILINY